MNKKRFLVLLLSFALIFTMVPLSAFASDGQEQESIPIQVLADGKKCDVIKIDEIGEDYGCYTDELDPETTAFCVKSGVYKVIVPSDATSLTFSLPGDIKSALDSTFFDAGEVAFAKDDKENKCSISASKLREDGTFGVVPIGTNMRKSFIDICNMNTDEGITHSYVNFCDKDASYYDGDDTDDIEWSAQYGLLIQFGGESKEQEQVDVTVENIALKDDNTKLRIGEANTVTATLKNKGTEAVSGFKVKLQADGVKVEEKTYNETIAGDGSATVDFDITPTKKDSNNNGKTELKVLVNGQEEGSKTETFVYGKYKIEIECAGTEKNEGGMTIASISCTGGYYDKNGDYVEYSGTNRPKPEDYLANSAGGTANKYILEADYGAKWDITFDTPDGQCFAYVEYENGDETKVKVGENSTKAQLVFDGERFGKAYYEAINAEIITFYTGIRGTTDRSFAKIAFDELVEGETYRFFLSYDAQKGAGLKNFTINIYEDERLVKSLSQSGYGLIGDDALGEYQPHIGAQNLKVEILQGKTTLVSVPYSIEVAGAQKKELQFMETPLNRSALSSSGLVGTSVSRVHILSDGESEKYITSGSVPLYYDGYGRWEPLEAKGTKVLLDLTGGYNDEKKIDLTTLKGVGSDGALYGFNGKEWVKEKESDLKNATLTQAIFLDNSIIGYYQRGTGYDIYIAKDIFNKDTKTLTWTKDNYLNINDTTSKGCYSLLLGDDGKVYATTYKGALCQYTDSGWTELKEATGFPAKVLAASSEDDIWISAQTGNSEAKILHYNGESWETYNTPASLKELPTGILVNENEMYCIYMGGLWKSTNNGTTWTRQNIESSGDAGSTLTGIQTTEQGIFYLGTGGAFYYEGTALGETTVSPNEYNARTVRIAVTGYSPSKGTSISYAGKVTVDNQFDLTPYLTYYRYGGNATQEQAAKVWGKYSAEDKTGFKYPTVLHALVKMLQENGCDFNQTTTYTYNGEDYTVPAILDAQANMGGGVYVAMAGGLREFDDGNMSGWMYTVNGEYPNLGLSQWSLEDGDNIVLKYVKSYESGSASKGSPTRLTTKEYGNQSEIEIDPGKTLTFHCEVKTGEGQGGNNSIYDDAEMAFLYVDGRRYYNYTESGAKETAMTDEYGILKMTFDKEGVYEIYCYKNGVNAQSNIITVTVGKGNVKPEIRLTASATRCKPNDKVTLTVKNLNGEAMQGVVLYNGRNDDKLAIGTKKEFVTDENGQAEVSFPAPATYIIYAKGEETKASQTVSIIVANEIGDIKTAMSDALELANTRANKLTSKTPWNSIALDRQISGDYTSGTLNELVQEIGSSIEANGGTQYELVTDYAKWVMAIQAAGGDPSSLVYKDTKINLLEKIYNYHVRLNDGTVKNIYAQGLNAPIWSLIALDSVPETVPDNARYSKADLVKYIVKAQHSDGSFSLNGSGSGDVDMTAMALQALAKHQSESGVKNAIDKAVNWLADQQKENGGFASYYSTENSESTAQTIIALTALGIDPAAEPFNTEGGKTMLDALLYYHLGDGSFAHEANTSGMLTANDMASEQAHLALTAYDRYEEKGDALYDMSSIERVDRYAPVITTDLRTYTTNETTVTFTVSAVDAKDGTVTPTIGFNRGEGEQYNELEPDEKGQYTVTVNWAGEMMKKQQVHIRITATDTAGNTAVEKYTVTYSIYKVIDSISLPKGVQTAEVGKTLNLTANVTPNDANNKTLEWKSSDPAIATVDENGNVKALKSGMVTITATTCDGSNLSAECKVVCELPQSQQADDKTIKVNFTLMGDSDHGETKPYHTLKNNNLTTWIKTTTVTVEKGSSVGDVFSQVLTKNGYSFEGLSKNYISYITTPAGVRMGEFTNGKLSGWMYTVNGHHPEVGLNSYILTNGDNIIWHYTDDYTVEEGSEKWSTKTEETKPVTTDTASGSTATTAPTETKVTEKTNADGTKEKTVAVTVSTDNQTEIIKQAADKKSTEIVLEVASTATNGAQNVQLQLNVSFVKNVSEKTDAALTVNTENGTVSLDQDTIKTVLSEAKGATITLDVNRVEKPTEIQKKAAGESGQILNLTVKSGGKTISDFKTGKVTVTVAIQAALQNKRVAAIHIAEDGKIQQMPGKSREVGGKKCYEFTTSHFSDFALVDADELGLETEDEIDPAALTAKLTPVARSAKTAKGYSKVTTSLDKNDEAIISELADAGYTVKYRFYRSTKKSANYKSAITKRATTYTNTAGKKGTKYFYKVQVRVYDESGKVVAKTALKQCRYACRTWSK